MFNERNVILLGKELFVLSYVKLSLFYQLNCCLRNNMLYVKLFINAYLLQM